MDMIHFHKSDYDKRSESPFLLFLGRFCARVLQAASQ